MLDQLSLGNPDMTDAIRPLIAGNWKMNGLKSSLGEFEAMLAGAAGVAAKADLLVCPPATLIASFAEKARGVTAFAVGAQDCHSKASGAHTGDISAEMLADAGATAVIVGHSERRADHGESDVLVRQKAEAAWRAGPSISATPGRPWISAAASSISRCRITPAPTIW
jgi:triosephosphate isomerase